MEPTDKEIEEVVNDLTLAELKQKFDQAKHLAAFYEKCVAEAEAKAHALNIERITALMDELGVTLDQITNAYGYQVIAKAASKR